MLSTLTIVYSIYSRHISQWILVFCCLKIWVKFWMKLTWAYVCFYISSCCTAYLALLSIHVRALKLNTQSHIDSPVMRHYNLSALAYWTERSVWMYARGDVMCWGRVRAGSDLVCVNLCESGFSLTSQPSPMSHASISMNWVVLFITTCLWLNRWQIDDWQVNIDWNTDWCVLSLVHK